MDILKGPFFSKLRKIDFNTGNHFFELFSHECWVLTLLAPITIIVPSLLMKMAIEASSFFIGFLLFLIYLVTLLPWVLVPTWFLLYITEPQSNIRKFAYGWMGVIFIAIVVWAVVL